MTIPRSAFGAVALSCVCGTALAQQPTDPPAIRGQVVAADSSAPLRRVRVDVSAGPWRAGSVLTDNDGRFFVEIPGAGTVPFTVTVAKGGYVTATTRVERRNAQSPFLIRLGRGAAISGTVVDASGAPAAGMSITARFVDAAPAPAGAPSTWSATADDLGEYRLGGLSPGRYEVWAGSSYTVLAAGNAAKDIGGGPKTVIAVEAGEEVGGIHLAAPAESAAQVALRLLRDSPGASQSTLVLDPDGRVVEVRRPPTAAGAEERPRRGGIRGRVLSNDGKPIVDATVRLVGGAADQRVQTNAQGGFSVDLPRGQYIVEVATAGRMSWQYGQDATDQSGRPVVVGSQTVEGIDIVMPQGRAVAGVVADEHGEPIQGARVQALRLQYAGGRQVTAPAGFERRTDDRGRYRLWGLHPGSYLIAASVDGVVRGEFGRQTAYATLYYPGTPMVAGAAPVELRNDAVADLVFTSIGLSDIRGKARDGDAPLVSGTARLIESRRSALTVAPRTAPIEMDGSFLIRNVPPGQYVLQVLGDGPGRTGLFGVAEVSVGLDPATVTISTSYGTAVEGRMVFESNAPLTCTTIDTSTGVRVDSACPRGTPPFTIGTVPLDDFSRDSTTGVIIAGGEFFVTGLFGPTSFALRRAPGDDWYLKSFTVNGNDILDAGFDFGAQPGTITDSEIVLSQNGAAAVGRVDDGANTASNYFVVAFPAGRSGRFPLSRRVKFTRSAVDGSFRIAGLPGGDYFLAAVNRLSGSHDGGEWQNPEVLAELESRAERVTLTEGQTRTVTLRLIQR